MTLTADFTKRLPAETLNEIIAWVDERKDLHATAHVCRRWRLVAFDRPRRFCWFRCHRQVIPGYGVRITRGDAPPLQLAFATLKCRLNHARAIVLHLGNMPSDTARSALKCLSGCIAHIEDLDITWDNEELTQTVFDTLASQPAPLLNSLVLRLHRHRAMRNGTTILPRIPSNIFAYISPVLQRIAVSGMDLPEAPLPQFSSVTTVSFDPNAPRDAPWDFQDRFSRHFPALNSMLFPAQAVVRLVAPSTPEGTLLMGRLTSLRMNESMLHDVLDAHPALATIPHLSVQCGLGAGTATARMLDRLLSHFADDEFALAVHHTVRPASSRAGVSLSREETPQRRREVDVPLAALDGVFARARAAGHALRLERAVIAGGAFAALWPDIPPGSLRAVQVYADHGLPDVPARRTLPSLREFVITRRRYMLSMPAEHITLQAGALSKFVRAALRVSGPRTVTLRLEGVSVDRVTPAVQRMFAQVVQERF